MPNVFLSEIRVKLMERCMGVRAVNSGNICLTDILIPKDDFKAFRAEEEVTRININKLNDILKVVKDD